jgi:polyhydroxybutyrate depolymerase
MSSLKGCILALGAVFISDATVADTVQQTITVNSIKRKYLLHVPANLKPTEGLPLVIALHGGHGTPQFMERETKFSELADREGFIVAYPAAYGNNWNDGRVILSSDAYKEKVDDVAAIAAIIDDISQKYTVDPKRIYVAGISNGAIMTHYLGARLSDRLAAIASVAGNLSDQVARQFNPKAPLSVLLIHGTADPIVPYDGGKVFGGKSGSTVGTSETVQLWSRSDRVETTPAASGSLPDVDRKDRCTATWQSWDGPGNTEVRLIVLKGGGHTWPDGKQYLPRFLVGNVCRDFSGTQVIWDFFKAHPKP